MEHSSTYRKYVLTGASFIHKYLGVLRCQEVLVKEGRMGIIVYEFKSPSSNIKPSKSMELGY